MRVSTIVLLAVFIINILCDSYIVKQVGRLIKSKVAKFIIFTASSLSYLAIILTSIVVIFPTGEYKIIKYYQEILVLVLIVLFLLKAIFTAISMLDYVPLKRLNPNKKLFTIASLPVLAFVLGVFLYGSLVVRKTVVYNKVTVSLPRLPEAFNGYKIVQISDLHLKTMYNDTAFIKSIVDSINSYNPNMIVHTGDLVSVETSELTPFINTLSKLKAKDGVFAIMGNHDYGDYKDLKNNIYHHDEVRMFDEAHKAMGWKLLYNESMDIVLGADTMVLIGVENWGLPPFRQYGDINESYDTLNDDKFKVLLSHNPQYWTEILDNSNIDLTLSGHIHAMQLKIGKYSPASLVNKYWTGLYKEGESYLYINDGLGCTLYPFRFGAYPEVTIITLVNPNL